MSRSLKKGPFIDPKLARKVAALGNEGGNHTISIL